MGVTIGVDAAKSGNNTHLLVIMRGRLSQKISLINSINWTQLKKINGSKNEQKVCAITGECV